MKENITVDEIIARVAELEDENALALYAIATALIDLRTQLGADTQRLIGRLDQLTQAIRNR